MTVDSAGNHIHPSAVIEEHVILGSNNYVGPFCYLTGHLKIGDQNRFEAYCSVGTRAEHRDFWHEDGSLVVGDRNTFREHITVNAGCGNETTSIGNDVILLRAAHVGHDSVVEDNVTLSCGAQLGGHVHVMQHSNLGIGACVHQHQVIGSWSLVGMGCVVNKASRIRPGNVYVGNPAQELRQNTRLLDGLGVKTDNLESEVKRYSALMESHGLLSD